MHLEISCSFTTRRCFRKDHLFQAEIVITPNEAYIPNVWVGRQQITSGKGRVSEEGAGERRRRRSNGEEDVTRSTARTTQFRRGEIVCHVGKKRERKYNAHGMIRTTDSAAVWTVGMRAVRERKGGLSGEYSLVQQLGKTTFVNA